MHSAASHRRPLAGRLMASLTVIPLLVGACAGAGGASTAPSSAATQDHSTAATSAPGLPPTTPPTIAATPGPTRVNVPVVAAEAPLKLLWEKAGTTPNAGATSAVAVAPDGRVYAISAKDGVIWVFTPDGTFVKSIGSLGSGPGQFNVADAKGNVWGWIAFAPDGSYYVTDAFNYRVEVFDRSDTFVRAFGSFGTGDGQFANPVGIALDPNANVYVADGSRDDIQEFGPDGAFIKTFARRVGFSNSQAPAIAIDPSGNVFAAIGRSIAKYAPDGTVLAIFNLMVYGYPDGFVADSHGNLWIPIDSTSNGHAKPAYLVELDPTGAVLHVWPPTGDLAALEPTGSAIYMAYFQAANVQKYELPK
jgi:sugar lactone lactonase YvrE